MNLPDEFSLVSDDADGVIATGPFVIDATISGQRILDLGFTMTRVDESGIEWSGFERGHLVVPVAEPVLTGNRLTFEDADGDTFLIRPLSLGDGTLVGFENPLEPASDGEARQVVQMIGEYLYRAYLGETDAPSPISEDNLYLTRDSSGEPLALVKMSASHPTLLRQDGRWRALEDNEDELLGHSDVPVREAAVLAWDSGDLPKLEDLLLDDRFSPSEVTNLWMEVSDAEDLKRLLVERSRGRFYERTRRGQWVPAKPDPDAVTADVIWSAVSAWDEGDLKKLSQLSPFDSDGAAA